MDDRSGADGRFITQWKNPIYSELQDNINCSKSSLFIVTEQIVTNSDTFETAIEIDGSRFQINSSFELQIKYNLFKDVGNDFSINKLIVFSTFRFIPNILSIFKSGSLYLVESN